MTQTGTVPSSGAALVHLERALEKLHELWFLVRGDLDRTKTSHVPEALSEVFDSLLRVYSTTADPLPPLEVAQRQITALSSALQAIADAPWNAHAIQLTAACSEDVSQADAVFRRSPATLFQAAPLAASLGTPRLQRGTLDPVLPELPREGAVPQLPAVSPSPAGPVPPGFSKDPLPALTHEQWVEFHARDCFGDVVALLPQRVSQQGEMWSLAEVIEQRLAANLDALAALGDAGYRSVDHLCRTALVVDPALCGGLALVAASVASRDLLSLCERMLLSWETDDAMWLSVADAWKLSPSPWLGAACERYLVSPDPRKRALAVNVLGYRWWLKPADVNRLLNDRALSQRSVLEHLHVLPLQERHDCLRQAYSESASRFGTPELWWAGALSGYHPTSSILEQALPTDATGEAALLVALCGERQHAETLLEMFTQNPTPDLARALGWAGLGSSIPILIEALTSADPSFKSAVAMALERITAAGLYEEVEIPPEQGMAPDVPEPEFEASSVSLATQLGDNRQGVPEGSPDTVVLPATSRETWLAYWQDNAARFSPGVRYRCGLPASPEGFVDELAGALRTPRDRSLLHRELIMRTGQRVRFDPHQWASEQHEAIEEWRSVARSCAVQPGTWFRRQATH
jgi:hypothetical protein